MGVYMADPIEVLDYWLGEVGPDGWYAAGEALDADIRNRFHDIWIAARDGGLDHWVDGTVGTLAFVILCDQMARNMHRGQADAFATDAMALVASRRAIEMGWDMDAPEPERQFFYMPLMHSEVLDDQSRCIALFQDKMPQTGADQVIHARAHHAVIARFGRFPFRNQALGRKTTPLEDEFMAEGAYATIVKQIRASHAPDA